MGDIRRIAVAVAVGVAGFVLFAVLAEVLDTGWLYVPGLVCLLGAFVIYELR